MDQDSSDEQSTGATVALSIGEVSAATGVSIDTLRYYERAGLLPSIRRGTARQRLFTEGDLGWIVFVRRLRATGMTVAQIRAYIALARQGERTLGQRRRLLDVHRETVRAAIAELQDALGMLDRKLLHYEAAER